MVMSSETAWTIETDPKIIILLELRFILRTIFTAPSGEYDASS
jgi:hypothetical protein